MFLFLVCYAVVIQIGVEVNPGEPEHIFLNGLHIDGILCFNFHTVTQKPVCKAANKTQAVDLKNSMSTTILATESKTSLAFRSLFISHSYEEFIHFTGTNVVTGQLSMVILTSLHHPAFSNEAHRKLCAIHTQCNLRVFLKF